VDVGRSHDGNATDPMADVDLAFVRWLGSRYAVEASRYVLVESDTLIECDLRDFYTHNLWGFAAVGMEVLPGDGDEPFWWDAPWRGLGNLPAAWRPHLRAVMPLCMTMVARDAALAYAGMGLPMKVHCEVRLATGLHVLGHSMVPHTLGRQTVSWHRNEIDHLLTPGAWRYGRVFHPVKQ
jgi:hypothetical protein